MTKQIAPSDYHYLRRSIAAELLAGAERVRQTYREEVVRTAWNIGKLLRSALGLEDKPGTANAALVARLSKDLGRPDSFFYDAAKFHRTYPSRVPQGLSWSHYLLLIRLDDPKKRLGLEKKVFREKISSKEMRVLAYGLTHPGLKTGAEALSLTVERGRLYHYRATNAPVDDRVLIDIGFGIERDVRYNRKGSLHSGLIVRAERNEEDYSAKISPFKKGRLYTYAASLDRVVDGDTMILRVDLGFRTWITQTFRLRGIDTPEVTCVLGRKAKAAVTKRLTPCTCLVIKSYKQEKYGRFLADVFYLKKAGDDREKILREGTFLNQELLDEGSAVPYPED